MSRAFTIFEDGNALRFVEGKGKAECCKQLFPTIIDFDFSSTTYF